jgi:diguanylate cyclase (GGDEF)-like protein
MDKLSNLKRFTNWIILVVVGTISYTFICNEMIRNNYERQKNYLDTEMVLFESKTMATLNSYESFSAYLYERFFNTAYIGQLVAQANEASELERTQLRADLHQYLADEYTQFSQHNFSLIQVHLKDGLSFLRLYQPDYFGDDLSSYRETIQIVKTQHRFVSGFEVGRVINGYRMVYPLFHQAEYVGSVELSISMGTVIQMFRYSYPNIQTTFIIDQDAVKAMAFDDMLAQYLPHPFIHGYYTDVEISELTHQDCVAHKTNCDLLENLFESEPDLLTKGTNISRVVVHQNQYHLVQFLLLKSISGVPVAYFIGISEDHAYQLITRHVKRDMFLIGALFLMVFLISLNNQLKRNQLEVLSNTDKLTSLPNRRKMLELMNREIERFQRYNLPVSIVMMDIDWFKRINDQYGHHVGDQVLVKFAEILKTAIRNLDVVSRWGGEEFLVLLIETNEQEARLITERLRKVIETSVFEIPDQITASFGIACIKPFESIEAFINRSDRALYQAKQEGRNCVRVSQ